MTMTSCLRIILLGALFAAASAPVLAQGEQLRLLWIWRAASEDRAVDRSEEVLAAARDAISRETGRPVEVIFVTGPPADMGDVFRMVLEAEQADVDMIFG